MQHWKTLALAGFVAIGTAGTVQAQVKVGIIDSLSGPAASIGVPYAKGYAAWEAGPDNKGLTIIQIDDASDPAAAARAAKKLVEEDHVDILVGSAATPPSVAIYGVAAESKTPMVFAANGLVSGDRGAWEISVPQPFPLMISADLDAMKKAGVKTVAYIGFSDAFGDLVYDSLKKAVEPAGIKVVADERYGRADTSVTPQILKIIAIHPDAVFSGGAGSPAALPSIALAERGYKGHVYATHGIINAEFVRLGGNSVEGLVAPTGPVVVAEQLPDSNPLKKSGLEFRALYEKANHDKSTDAFAAYGYDAMVLMHAAVAKALASTTSKPGTPEFRLAVRDAMVSLKDVVGTHAVYNFSPGERYGTDERSRVVVQLDHGAWKLVP